MFAYNDLNAVFVCSVASLESCPKQEMPEYAFIGRSNVGKSSLINYLAGQKDMARVSANPGKTQTINFYLCRDSWHIVDLPGFGFAKVSKEMRKKWDVMIKSYLNGRKQLQYVFLLLDARIPPQAIDLEFTALLGEAGIPFVLVFTKADKPGSNEIQKNIRDFKTKMLEEWEDLPPIFITSAEKRKGREEIVGFMETVNAEYKLNN